MRTEQLDALVEIGRTLSLTAASQHVHLTVQALSMSVKALEEELDLVLIHRTHKGVTLTPDGQALINLYRDFSTGITKLRQQKLIIEGELTIPANYHGLVDFLPRLLCELEYDAPDLRLNIVEMAQDKIFDSLLNGDYEVALVCLLNDSKTQTIYNLTENLTFFPLITSRAICQLSAAHPLAERRTLSIAELVKLPLVTYKPFLPSKSSLLSFLQTYDPRLQAEETNSQALYEARVTSGRKIGLTSEAVNIFNTASAIVNIPLKENITMYFGCATFKDAHLSPQAAFFIRYLKQYAPPEEQTLTANR